MKTDTKWSLGGALVCAVLAALIFWHLKICYGGPSDFSGSGFLKRLVDGGLKPIADKIWYGADGK